MLPPAGEDRLFRRLAQQVPERDVDRADRDHADALASERHRLAVHVLPQKLDVPGIGADQQRLQIEIDHLLGHLRRKRGIADAHKPVVGEHLDDQPAMKGEGAHGSLRKRQQIHRVGAEMRRQRDGLALPLHDAGSNFFNFQVVA